MEKLHVIIHGTQGYCLFNTVTTVYIVESFYIAGLCASTAVVSHLKMLNFS